MDDAKAAQTTRDLRTTKILGSRGEKISIRYIITRKLTNILGSLDLIQSSTHCGLLNIYCTSDLNQCQHQ